MYIIKVFFFLRLYIYITEEAELGGHTLRTLEKVPMKEGVGGTGVVKENI